MGGMGGMGGMGMDDMDLGGEEDGKEELGSPVGANQEKRAEASAGGWRESMSERIYATKMPLTCAVRWQTQVISEVSRPQQPRTQVGRLW